MCTLDVFDKIAGILLSFVSVIGIVYGIIVAKSYKSKLKERLKDSLFSFYSRLKIYLLDFQNRLGKSPEKCILLCKYTDDSVKGFEDFIKPNDDEIKSFVGFILDFITFLENTENQISLDVSFHKDFSQFNKILFDLTNLTGMTPYSEYNDNKPVIEEFNSINSLINNLLSIIENNQSKILGYRESTKQ
jgi:hypothetical protein